MNGGKALGSIFLATMFPTIVNLAWTPLLALRHVYYLRDGF